MFADCLPFIMIDELAHVALNVAVAHKQQSALVTVICMLVCSPV